MEVRRENLHDLLLAEADAVDKAARKATRHALLIRKRAGVPASSWIDGRLVIIPPEEIEVEDDPADDQLMLYLI